MICRKCGEDKPEEEYYKHNKQCNDCLAAKRKEWRDKNKDKVKQYTLKYLKENPEKHREYMRKWREKNKEHYNEYQRLYQQELTKKKLRENDKG